MCVRVYTYVGVCMMEEGGHQMDIVMYLAKCVFCRLSPDYSFILSLIWFYFHFLFSLWLSFPGCGWRLSNPMNPIL